jgi:hypothetical protein
MLQTTYDSTDMSRKGKFIQTEGDRAGSERHEKGILKMVIEIVSDSTVVMVAQL